jgi:DnaK suppressor protein
VSSLLVTPAQIADIKRLLDQRFLLLSMQVDRELHAESPSEIAITTPSDADWATSDQLADDQIARAERDTHELSAVEDALSRIRNKSYGTCVDCGADIDYLRLLAHPTASRCLVCQENTEHRS